MTNNRIRVRRTSLAGKIPSITDIQEGELGLNTVDKRLFSSDGISTFEIGNRVSSVAGRTGDVILTNTDVGLGNVPNIDATNASNITSGILSDGRLSGSYTGLVNITGSGNLDFSRFIASNISSLTSPSFTWSGDLDTGIYRPNPDQIGFALGGIRTKVITPTQEVNYIPIYITNPEDSPASATTTMVDSNMLYFRGKYWNGTTSIDHEWNIINDVWGTNPTSSLRFRTGTTNHMSVNNTGQVSAASFSGSGANLVSLNASNLSSGTVPSARLTGAYTNITSISLPGPLTLTNQGELRLSELSINGSNYTSLRSSPDITSDLVFTLPSTLGSVGQVLVSDGTGLLSWSSVSGTSNSLASLTDTSITSLITGEYLRFNGTFWVNTNNGSTLTSLNASNITTGTIADARLSSNVALLNTNQSFSAQNSFHKDTSDGTLANFKAGRTDSQYVSIYGQASGNTISSISSNTNPKDLIIQVTDSITTSNYIFSRAGTLSATTFSGALTGNASSATTLQTARTIGLSGAATGTATSFNGSVNITIPVTDLNASNLSSGTVPNARIAGAYDGITTLGQTGLHTITVGPATNAILLDSNLLADVTNTLRDAPNLLFRSKYWNGTASVNYDARLNFDITATTPTGKFTFDFGGVERASIDNTGLITAISFSGSGAALTALNASNLTTGTVPDGRITGSYTGLVNLTGTGTTTFASFAARNNTGGYANISTGSATQAGLLQIYKSDGTTRLGYIGWSNTELTYVSENGADHVFSGGTVNVSNTTASTTTATGALVVTGGVGVGGQVTATSFSGSGASLTSLNASNLSTGTLPDGRLSGAYSGFTNLSFSNTSGNGISFWGVNSEYFRIYMSLTSDATWGGRLDTTSDCNMYFNMTGGTNRGYVFQNAGNSIAQIEGNGNIRMTGTLLMNGNTVIDAGGGWHRSYGNTGWYNSTHQGGMYMIDSTWVRTYNGKGLHSEGGLSVAGSIVTINGIVPTNGAIRLTPNLHLNAGTATSAVIINWDIGGSVGTDMMFRVGNGGGGDIFYVRRDGFTTSNIFNTHRLEMASDVNNRFTAGNLVLRTITPTILFRSTASKGMFIKLEDGILRFLSTTANDNEVESTSTSIFSVNTEGGQCTFRNNTVTYGNSHTSGNSFTSGNAHAASFVNGSDTLNRFTSNALIIRGSSPTVYFRNTANSSAMIHCSANMLYFLRGVQDSETWTAVGGVWPLMINLNTNDSTFGGAITGTKATFSTSANQLTLVTTGSTANNKRWDLNVFNGDGHLYFQTWSDSNTFQANAAYITRAGVITCTSVTSTSDERVKDNFIGISDALNTVSQLKPWKYNHYNNNRVIDGNVIKGDTYKTTYGFVAQELIDVLPEAVSEPTIGNELYGLDYNVIIPILTKAIQEQQDQIDVLKITIKALMSKLDSISI